MEEESLAMSLLKDYKKNNKRMFALLVIILILWFATIGSFVWYINQFDNKLFSDIIIYRPKFFHFPNPFGRLE